MSSSFSPATDIFAILKNKRNRLGDLLLLLAKLTRPSPSYSHSLEYIDLLLGNSHLRLVSFLEFALPVNPLWATRSTSKCPFLALAHTLQTLKYALARLASSYQQIALPAITFFCWKLQPPFLRLENKKTFKNFTRNSLCVLFSSFPALIYYCKTLATKSLHQICFVNSLICSSKILSDNPTACCYYSRGKSIFSSTLDWESNFCLQQFALLGWPSQIQNLCFKSPSETAQSCFLQPRASLI